MNTTRRKSSIYPVAIAITLMIASRAYAQLCPATAESTPNDGFAEQTGLAESLAITTENSQISGSFLIEQTPRTNVAEQAYCVTALTRENAVEASAQNVTTQPSFAHSTTEALSERQDDLIRKLLRVASQPMLAEANLQPMFAD